MLEMGKATLEIFDEIWSIPLSLHLGEIPTRGSRTLTACKSRYSR